MNNPNPRMIELDPASSAGQVAYPADDGSANTTSIEMTDSPPSTLTKSVYEQLKADVLSGNLRPQEKLRGDALRLRFRTGSSPVREALNRLLAEGLVVLEDQKGFRVAPVSAEEFAELVLARTWIDGAAIAESIARFDPQWEESLVVALHRLSRTPRRPVVRQNFEWDRRHKALHAALVAGCGSRWIMRISNQLFDAADRYRVLAEDYAAATGRNDLDEHRAIVEACFERNAELAVKLLEQHYRFTYTLVGTSLKEMGERPSQAR